MDLLYSTFLPILLLQELKSYAGPTYKLHEAEQDTWPISEL